MRAHRQALSIAVLLGTARCAAQDDSSAPTDEYYAPINATSGVGMMLSQPDAEALCATNGGHLASMHTEAPVTAAAAEAAAEQPHVCSGQCWVSEGSPRGTSGGGSGGSG